MAVELVLRLNRTVQRVTIYPKGHPAAREAIAPFLAASRLLFGHIRHLSLLVSRQLLVACDSGTAEPVQAAWLSSRLSERGVASLALTNTPTDDDALELVSWLARPASDPSPPPPLPGVLVTLKDYSNVRFCDEAATGEVNADALLMWQSVAHGLTTDWVENLHDGPAVAVRPDEFNVTWQNEDPLDLAKFVRRALIAQEGTGISALATSIVHAGGRLATLDDAGRAVVRRKLGSFIGELAPELRGQLLRVVPNDSPEKLQLLTEVIDELPRAVVLDIMQTMQVGRSAKPQRMVSLLTKMVSLSASDPDLSAAVGSTLARAGLPPELSGQDPTRVQRALEILLSTPIDDESVSADYRRQLDALAESTAEAACVHYDASRFLLPMVRTQVAIGTTKIAVVSLAATPLDADTVPILLRTRGTAAGLVESGDIEGLITLARVVSTVAATEGVEEAEVEAANAVLSLLGEPAAVALFLDALGDPDTPSPDGIVDVLRAGGVPAVLAALRRVAATPAGSGLLRDRLFDLLLQLDTSTLTTAVTEARTRDHLPARVVLDLIDRLGATHGAGLAGALIQDADATLRLRAFGAAFSAAPGPLELDRLLRQALEDRDERIVALALAEARARHATVTVRVLAQFLGRTVDVSRVPAQIQAIAALASMETPAARSALASALAHRRRAWDRASRLVSRRLADRLDRFGDEPSRRAAKAWRRSPAGLLSLMLRERVEAA